MNIVITLGGIINMRNISYAVIGTLIITIVLNVGLCCAKDFTVAQPFMQTPTTGVIDLVHYARTLCDDVVLRIDEMQESVFIDRVDMIIARVADLVCDMRSFKSANIDFIPEDMIYIESIAYSMFVDLKSIGINIRQQKTLLFLLSTLNALAKRT